MDFGHVVQQRRKELGFDLRTMAAQTGIDPTTISRIENGRAQATLSTAVQLCERTGISLTDLFYALLGKQLFQLKQQEPPEETVIPTESDAETLVTQFHQDKPLCALYLTHVLNRIVSLSQRSQQLKEYGESLQFVPEDITQLLLARLCTFFGR
jgi:transcriptional regulator with XRE-family HTH domain